MPRYNDALQLEVEQAVNEACGLVSSMVGVGTIDITEAMASAQAHSREASALANVRGRAYSVAKRLGVKVSVRKRRDEVTSEPFLAITRIS